MMTLKVKMNGTNITWKKATILAATEQARNLNYSRAMNILRSPGLATDPPATIVNQLHDLHPPETVPLKVVQPEFIITVDDFQFIDTKWVTKQIRRSKRGTAVD